MSGRACTTCEWSDKPEHLRGVLQCREGPLTQQVFADHWCGRWRLAERLSGGRDSRLTNTDNRGTK